MGLWDIVTKAPGDNFVTQNPGFEYADISSYVGVALAQTPGKSFPGYIGGYCLVGTPTADPNAGLRCNNIDLYASVGAQNTYTISFAHFGGRAGQPWQAYLKDNVGAQVGSTFRWLATRTSWARKSFQVTLVNPTTHTLYIAKDNDVDQTWFGVDCIMAERNPFLTTYIDGDQTRCSWLGTKGASRSYRDNVTRLGGRLMNLETDFGFYVKSAVGIGAPPVMNYSTPYPMDPGGYHEHTKIMDRPFTLNGTIKADSLAELHRKRDALYQVIKPNVNDSEDEPIILKYSGGDAPLEISAFYNGGMEMSELEGFSERIALRFVATSPNWRATLL